MRLGPGGVRVAIADRLLRLAAVAWTASLVPSLAGADPDGVAFVWADQYSDVPTMLLLLWALRGQERREGRPAARVFWRLLGAGMLAWMGVRGLYFVVDYPRRGIPFDLATDAMYLVGYLCVALALEWWPGIPRAVEGGERPPRTERVGTLVFGFVLLSYFTFAPSVFNPRVYSSWVSSLFLYAVLDAYLVVRAVALLRSTPDPAWRAPMRWILATLVLWFAGDVVEGTMYLGVIPFAEPGRPTDVLWAAPALVLLVAVRSRGWALDSSVSLGVRAT